MIKKINNYTKYDFKILKAFLVLMFFVGIPLGILAKSKPVIIVVLIFIVLACIYNVYLLSKKIVFLEEKIVYKCLFFKKSINYQALDKVYIKISEFNDKSFGIQRILYLCFVDNVTTIKIYCSEKNIAITLECLKKYANEKYMCFVLENRNNAEIISLLKGTPFLADFYKKYRK